MSFNKGEVHAIVGENGAGKSTFIKSFSRVIRADAVTIILVGDEINTMVTLQRSTASPFFDSARC
jgi:ABC-type sugar transport system ATPase subunit